MLNLFNFWNFDFVSFTVINLIKQVILRKTLKLLEWALLFSLTLRSWQFLAFLSVSLAFKNSFHWVRRNRVVLWLTLFELFELSKFLLVVGGHANYVDCLPLLLRDFYIEFNSVLVCFLFNLVLNSLVLYWTVRIAIYLRFQSLWEMEITIFFKLWIFSTYKILNVSDFFFLLEFNNALRCFDHFFMICLTHQVYHSVVTVILNVFFYFVMLCVVLSVIYWHFATFLAWLLEGFVSLLRLLLLSLRIRYVKQSVIQVCNVNVLLTLFNHL